MKITRVEDAERGRIYYVVLTGHYGRFIAHKKYGTHIVRAVYEYDNDLPVVVTAYYPLVTRYFKGGGTYADKILP